MGSITEGTLVTNDNMMIWNSELKRGVLEMSWSFDWNKLDMHFIKDYFWGEFWRTFLQKKKREIA